MTKQELIKIFKGTLLIYAAAFLVINWNDVSWMFNYKEVAGLVEDFFNPYPGIADASIQPYFYQNSSGAGIKGVQTGYTDQASQIEIPKIGINVPIIFATSTNENDLENNLDQGVVDYPGSVYPGQVGQMVILGHSAPPGWPHIKHDWTFTDLDKLSVGDSVLVDFNNKQYTYIVKNTKIIKRGEIIPAGDDTTGNTLNLISCWPPGKDYQRIVVQAELKV